MMTNLIMKPTRSTHRGRWDSYRGSYSVRLILGPDGTYKIECGFTIIPTPFLMGDEWAEMYGG